MLSQNRRKFIGTSLKTGLLSLLSPFVFADALKNKDIIGGFPQFLDLEKISSTPIVIKSIDILKAKGEIFVVTTSHEGAKGITMANTRIPNLISLMKGLVIPYFIGKDARKLESLVDGVFVEGRNYKYAGMPFWNCVGHVEVSIFDMLGKIGKKPIYELLGKPLRTEVPVYLSSLTRDTTPEQEGASLLQRLSETKVKAVKIKVGGRMRNSPDDHRRTLALVPHIRKTLGDEITIYADANSSYTVKEGIEVGHLLEDNGVEIFEEPCWFEEYDNTKKITKALKKIKVAGGEQDTSEARFRWIIENEALDIIQPDIYYNGGIIRTLRVAKMAAEKGLKFAPHSPKTDPLAAPMLHLVSVVPNLFGNQEVNGFVKHGEPWYTPSFEYQEGFLQIPKDPGLGVKYDDQIWEKAEKIE